jgi:hypothetical protein
LSTFAVNGRNQQLRNLKNKRPGFDMDYLVGAERKKKLNDVETQKND